MVTETPKGLQTLLSQQQNKLKPEIGIQSGAGAALLPEVFGRNRELPRDLGLELGPGREESLNLEILQKYTPSVSA